MRDAGGRPLVEIQVEEVAWRASNWYYMVTGTPPKYECRPDWFSVLLQPCDGSAASQMQQCLQDRPPNHTCRSGCSSLRLAMPKGYCNAAECWPPWVLKQMCNSDVQDFLNATRFGWCTNVWCPSSCRGMTAAKTCSEPCVHEACAVAAHFVRNSSWTEFRGQCKHTAAVDRLLAGAPSMFEGENCSILSWVDSSITDLDVLLSKVCQGTYPRPASLMPMLPNPVAVDKMWLGVAARDYAAPLTGEALLEYAGRSPLSFASTQQAAILNCAAGYMAMDRALGKPLLSAQLLDAVLPSDSAWRVRLLQGMPNCSLTKYNDVCLNTSGVLGVEWLAAKDAQLVPWLVSNTSLSVLQAYCRRAFAPASTDSHTPLNNVTASCDKVSRETDKIRGQHAARRMALAFIWYGYVIFLLVGFLGLQMYWRLPKRRSRGARDSCTTCIAKTAGGLWHMLCPTVPEYHPGVPQAPHVASQGWVHFTERLVHGLQALAYCVDVGLDIWTLVELRKNVESFASAASEYPSAGDYARQLSWRSGHNNMLFEWLIIVFVVQYAAGILLTLPPTLAAYGIFNYQRLKFSCGCCMMVFLTGAAGVFVGLFFFVGVWYILVADFYMLLAVVGVPAKLLQGNRLNMPAYTTVRYLCEGIIEALPSALISTAALNQQLLSQETNVMQLGVFWMSLIFSMLRIARELYKLACLTHDLDACCFSTAILDMIYHVQPQQGAGAAPAQGQLSGSPSRKGSISSHSAVAASTQAPASGPVCGPAVTAPQPDTGMTRDSAVVNPGDGLTGDGSSAGVDVSQQSASSCSEAAAAVDAPAAAPVSSTSNWQWDGCCWRCQSCTEYPTVLAVYVYCWLGCIMVYLLLVCTDVAYPWLLSAVMRMERICDGRDADGFPSNCSNWWNHTLPPFSQEYNLLMMITSVPGLSNASNAVNDCVLPSLTCD